MDLHHPHADLFVPDGTPLEAALARTTHLCVGAHPDDQEFMAYHGIDLCHDNPDRWFTGVVVTDGGGSARAGRYAAMSDAEMRAVRRAEQRRAAATGKYACQIQLAWPSAVVKTPPAAAVVEDLVAVLAAARPEVVYLHNLADRHDTHVACALRALEALRALPAEARPTAVLGCEVWRDLDWMVEGDKRTLRTDGRPDLARRLAEVFDSQLAGGKRYDLAIHGRWRANATMLEAHAVDAAAGITLAMDLGPLVLDPALSPRAYVLDRVDRFRRDVVERLDSLGAG